MKRMVVIGVAIVLVTLLVFGVLPAMAAKPINPDTGVPMGNGMPSGPHFNLNLHGRNPATWSPGSIEPFGGSIWISNDGSDNTIEYVSNKKNSDNVTLYVIDPLSEAFGPPYDPAQVYLPYKVWDDANEDDVQDPDEYVDAEGYLVFGRILGKPNAGSSGNSTVMIYPNIVVSANNTDNSTWPWGLDDVYINNGLITTKGNLLYPTEDGYYREFNRFDPPTDEKGKGNKRGKSRGKEITELFMWSGYVTDNTSLDASGDGSLDIYDLRYSANTSIRSQWVDFESEWLAFYQPSPTPAPVYDSPDGLVLDNNEFIAWLHWLSLGDYGVQEYNEAWIFDIAEMVISGQTVVSDGAKLFQIRFYPYVFQQP